MQHAVFQGNIVVSGGENSYNDLSSVESYDVFSNKWSLMPKMINAQSNQSLVNEKDKLFVIGCSDFFTTFLTIFV